MRFVRYHRYPSDLWGKALAHILRTIDLDANAAIVDAPCGDGVIVYWLIREGIHQPFELYDLSEQKVRHAENLSTWAKARGVDAVASKCDLHELPHSAEANDVWLLINSFFMFEAFHDLVERMRPRTKYILGLFPATSDPDYQTYVQRNPGINLNEMDEAQTTSFFAAHGYELCHRQDITSIPTRFIRPHRVGQAVRLVISPFERFAPKRNGLYWIGLFRRVES